MGTVCDSIGSSVDTGEKPVTARRSVVERVHAHKINDHMPNLMMMMIGLPTKSITKQEDKQTQQVWHIQAEEGLIRACTHTQTIGNKTCVRSTRTTPALLLITSNSVMVKHIGQILTHVKQSVIINQSN
jgi:hypothetical protein